MTRRPRPSALDRADQAADQLALGEDEDGQRGDHGYGGASGHLPLRGSLTLYGPVRAAGPDRVLVTDVLPDADGQVSAD